MKGREVGRKSKKGDVRTGGVKTAKKRHVKNKE